jgi:hypothetical protein
MRNLLWSIPLYLFVPVPFFLLANLLDIEINYIYMLLGALGWWLALILRLPIILIAKLKKLDLNFSSILTIGSSGPTEESVRLVLLSIIRLFSHNAYSIGLGWAMIEIIYGIAQIIGIGVLEQKTDEKAIEAKNLMKQMGMDKSLESSTPFWGVLERVSASAIHIGFSLLLVFSPYVLIFTIPFHSFINFFVVRVNKISIKISQLSLFGIASLVLLLGILLSYPY